MFAAFDRDDDEAQLEDREHPLAVVDARARGEPELEIAVAAEDGLAEGAHVGEAVKNAPHAVTRHPALAPRKAPD